MNKGIGFRRNIYLAWMDAAASFSSQTDDVDLLRAQLDPVVREQIASDENRRIALDILINIWGREGVEQPALHREALALYRRSALAEDRLWLHYGMTMLTYDFFRQGVIIVGQLSRYSDTITPREVKKRMIAELGQLGALEKATERILFSLRNWGILVDAEPRYTYAPRRRFFAASDLAIEEWMLAVTAAGQAAEETPFADLMRQPELFPFQFSITVDHLRRSARFEVQRQGAGWDMVRVVG